MAKGILNNLAEQLERSGSFFVQAESDIEPPSLHKKSQVG
jgi:hypothetical protein